MLHLSAPALLLLLAGSALAQLRGGHVTLTNFNPNPALYNITPAGMVTQLLGSAVLSSPSGLMVDRARDALVAEFSANRILRVTSGGQVTTVASGVPSPIRMTEDEDGDYLIASLGTPPALLELTPGGVLTTIYAGAPLVGPFGLDVDSNGDIIVADQRVNAVFRVTRLGAVQTVWAGAPLRLPQGVAIRNDGAIGVGDGLVDVVFLISRAGTISTLTGIPAQGNPDSVGTDAQNGFWLAESGTSAGGFICNCLTRISPLGARQVVASGAPLNNPEAAYAVPFLVPSGLLQVGQSVNLGWDVPTDAGFAYVLAASLSVFPGFALADGRALSLNFDALFLLSVGANNAVFANFIGVIDALGHGTGSINCPNIPALAGFDIYVQGATLSAGAPSGIATISDLVHLRIRP
jgi:hypothetical protein